MIVVRAFTIEPGRLPLSDLDRATIRYMAEDRRSRVEIAGAIGRSVGTISSEMSRLRRVGEIPGRAANA